MLIKRVWNASTNQWVGYVPLTKELVITDDGYVVSRMDLPYMIPSDPNTSTNLENSMIKQIAAFETSDGTVFKDMTDANKHEQKNFMLKELKDLVEDNYWRNMTSDDIVELIFDNKNDIKQILNYESHVKSDLE